ncbi:thioesterase family protein [Aliiroseovarius sp. KMU-50]|uniref:Thioesterase family protein n=1 Tax=Aliiroseovarius salicola TaxID=3009082 RepID=A0ABT4W6K8_9RHOB|nr:thioesterase family protein [Aliiroseovarius sp. KMU-50]MDA5095478.1 thioesterase family protein [Aliiroseovarius sp. KMU-50]
MSKIFIYETTVHADWIDYNGHMQDAFYGLVFSYAVDALQDEIGFDEAYRERTGCTIYLLEDHKYYLKEVKQGAQLRVETAVLDSDDKRFHLHLRMIHDGADVAICEFMELHVQKHPTPHASPMPESIARRLEDARYHDPDQLKQRSREIALKR